VDSKKIIFISDAHFGIALPGFDDREQQFHRFLDRETPALSEMYIIGDLFDFWIEYKYAIRPDYFTIIHHLKMLVDCGIKIHYFAGNHDFALGPFLAQTIGISVYPEALSREIQGKRVYLYHGDGLIGRDIGYHLLKKILRSEFNQRIYKLLHPNIGVPFGSYISGSSRKYLNKPLSDQLRMEYGACARNRLREGHDIVFFGHIHQPEFIHYPEGLYCNTGAWLKQYTYATMQNGELSLHRYHDGADDELLPVRDANQGSSKS
jgi:UDP-2,3-diacylglucosamine hydrolase